MSEQNLHISRLLRFLILLASCLAMLLASVFVQNTPKQKTVEKVGYYIDDLATKLSTLSLEELKKNRADFDMLSIQIVDGDSMIWWKELAVENYLYPLDFIEFKPIPRQENSSQILHAKLALVPADETGGLTISSQKMETSHYFDVQNERSDYPIINKVLAKKYYLEIGQQKISGHWNFLLGLLIFFVFVCFFIYNYIERDRLFRRKPKRKVILLNAVLLLAYSCLIIYGSEQYQFLELIFSKLDFSIFLLFVLLFSQCTIAIISSKDEAWPKVDHNSNISSSAYSFLGNFLIYSSLLIYIFLLKFIVSTFSEYLPIANVFNSSLLGFGLIVSCLLMAICLFAIHFKVYKNSFNASAPLLHKVLLMVVLFGFMALFGFALGLDIKLHFLFVGLIIYHFILDLLQDTPRFNLTAFILWMVIISSLFSILVFMYATNLQTEKAFEEISKHYRESDKNEQREVLALEGLFAAVDLSPIGSLVYPSKANKEDLNAYFLQNIPQLDTFFQKDYQVRYFLMDNFGNNQLDNPDDDFAPIQTQTKLFEDINSITSYNPFLGYYLFDFKILNLNQFAGPSQLYVQLIPPNDLPKSLKNIHIYRNNLLLFSSNNKQLGRSISGLNDKEVVHENGQKYFVKRLNEEITIIGSEPASALIKPISLFSYCISILGLLLFLISILDYFFNFLPSSFKFSYTEASLRNRIQISVVALILFSFFVIGIVTVLYFQRIAQNTDSEKLDNKTFSLTADIRSDINYFKSANTALFYIRDKLSNYQRIHDTDLFIYDEKGRYTSSTILANERLRFRRLPFDAKKALDSNPKSIIKDIRKKTSYVSSYTKLQTAELEHVGYIELVSKKRGVITNSVSDFIGTLLNVYVFLFFIAGALAIAVSNSITYPITVLGDKLRKFKLGKRNEPLDWKSKDELGILIQDYNQMIEKLEESAEIIARTERDTAWKEMAKQVAHEIKNPLTPMKLSIQYLERAVGMDPIAGQKLVMKVSNTLIEQIDNLTQIANEFSNFATLPKASNTKVILNEVVETIHELFRKRDDMDIILHEPIDDIVVFADKNQLIRILNNLVKNAIQAIPDSRRGKIQLYLYAKKKEAVIKVKDNGVGIPEAMKEKVFSPNFTTKSSGTGLGLAISTNMMDSINGKIYFETIEGKGTDFYISIPLMKHVKKNDDLNRVSLD